MMVILLFSFLILIIYYILSYLLKDLFNSLQNKLKENEINNNNNNNNNNENNENRKKILQYKEIPWSNELIFYLNNVKIQLINPNPTELLATYIRDKVGLKGTKLGCEEGGCGACTVVLTKPEGTVSVNSCLRPLCTNDGYSITTIEGIGSIDAGLSTEQSSIVEEHGTQCGYCTPGWITNMHALNMSIAETNPDYKPTGREIDAYFDGNICRCTGYKPILKAFKKNCTPEDCLKCPHAGTSSCHDIVSIEDIVSSSSVSSSSSSPTSISLSSSTSSSLSPTSCEKKRSTQLRKRDQSIQSLKNYIPAPLHFSGNSNNTHWYRPVDLSQLCAILRQYSLPLSTSSNNIQLVGGNTSIGVTKYLNNTAPYNKEDIYNIFIDINSVPELSIQNYDSNTQTLTVGASTTLSELIQFLNHYANKAIDYNQDVTDESKINHNSIFSVTAHHLRRIANTQVRNAGTWAGNLGIFKKYSSFPSDVVLSFTTSNAILSICDFDGNIKQITMEEFIHMNSLTGYLILNVTFQESPVFSSFTDYPNTIAETFKICIREHNAHAQVNAGFNLKIIYDKFYKSLGPLCQNARIVYGGVSAKTFIAHRAENILINSRITSNTLQRALSALQLDLQEIGISTSYGDNLYRQSVMQTCLYRTLLRTYLKNDIPSNIISATYPFIKPQSRGTELYTEVKNKEPIRLPVPKLEAKAQTTGEAIYPSDEPLPSQGLCASIVYTTQCACILSNIDPTPALSLSGVIAFFGAKDIPGTNTLNIGTPLYLPIGEEVLTIGTPVGIVVAISDEIANIAASLVKLTYTSNGKIPITNITEAISQKSFYDLPPLPGMTFIKVGNPEEVLNSSPRRVKGTLLATGQSHFYMEAQSSISSFIDGDILQVTCGTQDLTTFQNQIINIVNLPASQVQVKCSRTGGAFGGKLTGGIVEACSSALASRLVKRPVRIFNTRTSDMYIHSGREAYSITYEIGFDNDGKILALIYDIYCDVGSAYQDSLGSLTMAMRWADNAFYFPNYLARATLCFTNTPPRTYARAPGLVQSCLATSVVVERVANELGINEEYVKSLNFLQDGLQSIGGQVITNSTLNRCWDTLLRRSLYNQRLSSIQNFNKNNLWRKKGISIEPVKYGIGYAYYNAGCQIGIYKSDGTITVCHSGVEMGQGINTKVSQVISAELGVDISFIRVTTPSTSRIANGGTTGGSGTSEVCCQAALEACRKINARLLPYKKKQPNASWLELLSSLSPDVSLNADGWYSPSSNPNGEEFQYYVWGACVSEIEYDVLSGMVNVLSSEIIYDNGLSINPYVDLGQIEGAFIMGLGYMLQERIDYDSNGLLESIGTWEYKPPLAQDIPSIFNVTLLSGAPNKGGILRSKAVGEPSIVLANSIYFATKMAIKSSRLDAGDSNYFDVNAPLTIDVRQTSSLVSSSRFIMPK